jgi:SPP1 gp7 family putative phage head morphogenesis protein
MIDHAQPYENAYTKSLIYFFDKQTDEAVDNLKNQGYPFIDYDKWIKIFNQLENLFLSGSWDNANKIVSGLYQKAVTPDEVPDLAEYEEDLFKIIYSEFGQYLLPSVIEEWAAHTLNTLEVGITFNPDVPQIDEFINAYSYKMAVNVNDTTKRQIQELFKQALDEGNSVPQIEKKLRSLFTDISKVRANMIARSEVIRAHNAAADASYIQSGVVEKKKWYTAADERRCAWCKEMHGKEILVSETWFNQGDRFVITDAEGKARTMKLDYSEIRYPPLHVKCRCVLLPIIFEIYRRLFAVNIELKNRR